MTDIVPAICQENAWYTFSTSHSCALDVRADSVEKRCAIVLQSKKYNSYNTQITSKHQDILYSS